MVPHNSGSILSVREITPTAPIDNTAAVVSSLPDKNAKSSFNAVLQIENTDKSEVHSFTANIKLYLVLLHH